MACEDATVRFALRIARSVEARIFLDCVKRPLAFTSEAYLPAACFPAVLLVQHAGEVHVHVRMSDAQARTGHDFDVALRQVNRRGLDAQPTSPALSAEMLDEPLHLTPKVPRALCDQIPDMTLKSYGKSKIALVGTRMNLAGLGRHERFHQALQARKAGGLDVPHARHHSGRGDSLGSANLRGLAD